MPFPIIQNQNKKRSDREDSKDPLADLPEWLEEFKENLVDTELHASAHSSQESDVEHPTKVATTSRKHKIKTHFPKDRNCDVFLRTKITGEAVPRAEKFGYLITVDHKVLNEGMGIKRQSPVRSRGTVSCHSMDSVLSV